MNGIPRDEAIDNAVTRLKEDWGGRFNEIPAFLVKKTIWVWQDNIIPINYFLNESGLSINTEIKEMAYLGLESVGASYTQIWYIFSMLLGVIGIVFILKKNNPEIENIKFTLCNLIILGYAFMTLLSEGQSRYKCLIIPFICIINAYAILNLCDIVKSKLFKVKNVNRIIATIIYR